ncbi:MAG: flippase [PVC group bacterium]
MSEVKRIAGNTAALVFGRGIRLLVSIVLGIVLARYLGQIHYGNWTVARSLCALLTILSSLGLSKIAIRECAVRVDEAGRYLGTVLALTAAFSLISVLVAVLLVSGLGYHAEIAWLVFIALGVYILSSLGEAFVIQFRSREKMGYEALSNICKDLLLMLLVFLAVYLSWGVLRVAGIYLFAAAAYVLFSWALARKKFPSPPLSLDLSLAPRLILGGLPLALAIFFNSYHEVTRIIIQKTIGSAGAGYYSAAVLPYMALESTVIIAIMGAVFPVLSRRHLIDRPGLASLYRRMSRYLFMLSLPVALYCLFLGDELILIMFGPDYLDAVPVLKTMGPVFILMFQNYLLYNAMVACRKEWCFAWIMGVGALINAAAAVFFTTVLSRAGDPIVIGNSTAGVGIRLIGVTGGPIALIIAQLFTAVALSLVLYREYRQLLILKKWLRPFAAALLTGGLIRWEGMLDLPAGVVLASSAVFYGLLLFFLGSFDRTDQDIFMSILFTARKE